MIHVSKIIIKLMSIIHTYTGAFAIGSITSDSRNRMCFRYHCNGNEASLQSCTKYSLSSYAESWYNRPRAAVECQQMNINLTSKIIHALVHA